MLYLPRLASVRFVAARMTSVLNAELLAFFSIPLAATLMSRGVGYANWLPWQARSNRSK